jgi:hypothetical protein
VIAVAAAEIENAQAAKAGVEFKHNPVSKRARPSDRRDGCRESSLMA